MPDAILLFTFSPVQSFIAEARRASDLYVGSQILVSLAKAAASVMQQRGMLIYPASPLKDDAPNKLVARVTWENAEAVAKEAEQVLLHEWTCIADTARNGLMGKDDVRWHDIWTRQVSHLWEIYWAAAKDDGSYKAAYEEASQALDAVKRTRMFAAAEEQGMKDTLSGCREALHLATLNAKNYWTEVAGQVGAAKLRPRGRERLDAIGAVKRFSELADQQFPSTSTVASRPFLDLARQQKELAGYRQVVEELLKGCLYKPNRHDPDWPYDGDLLFMETLTKQRLEGSYGLTPDEEGLEITRYTLGEVYDQVKARPSPYYAIIALDGDNMGEKINTCLAQPVPQQAHEKFSRQLAVFSEQVKQTVPSLDGSLIYNGGDDVVALAPLSTAFGLAAQLATQFNHITEERASAGIAIVHHLSPLEAALQAARAAEGQAKQVPGKNALCVQVLKRSGETVEMRSPWYEVSETFPEVVHLFKGDAQGAPLSGRFAYDVLHAAYALPDADEKCRAELKRLLKRHQNPKHPQAPDPDEWAKRLKTWASYLPTHNKFEELGCWLVFARFVAQEGGE